MTRLFVLILLCSAVQAQDRTAVSKMIMQSCGPTNVDFQVNVDRKNHPLGTVDPGKALVYVIEDQKTKFVRDVTIRIGMDGNWMGADRGNSYFFLTVEPGAHHLCADWETSSDPGDHLRALANFVAEAGKVYYYRARTLGSVESAWTKHPNELYVLDLDPVNDDQGQLLVASSGFSISHATR